LVLDLNDVEDKEGEADLPLALIPSLDAVTLLQMDGEVTLEEFEQLVNMAVEGCKQIHKLQKEALKAKYITVKEEPKE
jgi:exosome complex component RRP41